MKKISIMLLAALMLFAFVACDENKGNEPVESKLVKPMAGTATFTVGESEDYTVSDFQKDVKILEDGTVEGTFTKKQVPEWNVDTEENGYYLLATLEVEKNTEFKISNSETTTATEAKPGKYTNDGDNELMFFLGDTEEDLKGAEVKIWVKPAEGDYAENPDITLTFKNAKVATAE